MLTKEKQVNGAPSSVRWLLGSHAARVLAALAFALFAVGPASAQKVPPEIKAKERSDPAAGEVIIINPDRLRERKANPPDPYAPIKLNPLPAKPETAAPQRAAIPTPAAKPPLPPQPVREQARRSLTAPSEQEQDQARTSEIETDRDALPPLPPKARRTGTATASREADAPPLPAVNPAVRNDIARLRQFPPHNAPRLDPYTPRASVAPNRTDRDDAEDLRAAAERREALRRRADERRREARLRDRGDEWRDRVRRDADRYYARRRIEARRPWRVCRRLAFACEDGYAGACERWRRRCAY